jgi:hypothetical protein
MGWPCAEEGRKQSCKESPLYQTKRIWGKERQTKVEVVQRGRGGRRTGWVQTLDNLCAVKRVVAKVIEEVKSELAM